MKKYFLLLAFCCLGVAQIAKAQVDILLPPIDQEKKESVKVIDAYLNYLNQMSRSKDEALKKKISVAALKDIVSGSGIFVYNDLDSLSAKDNFINVLKYNQGLPLAYSGQPSVSWSKAAVFDKVKYDKIRKYHYLEVKAQKVFTWKKLVERKVQDTAAMVLDTNAVASDTTQSAAAVPAAPVYDTLTFQYKVPLTFYVKYKKENNVNSGFRIFAVSKTGTAPKLEPLPELVQWWIDLDPEWRAYIKKMRKLEDYPRELELEKVTGIYDLNLSNSGIKNLKPLSKFVYLESLDISNNPGLTDASTVFGLTSLYKLNISKTGITSLEGIEKLKKLEELKCVGLKLTSLTPVKTLVNLREFDCSENELDDLSVIGNLKLLKKLNVSLNIKVKDISFIKNLDSLEKVSLRKIDVRDLAPFSKLKNLVYLDVYHTNITSLEPLRALNKLFHLNIDHNKVSSLDPIKHLKYMAYLSLSSSSITDLSAINNFPYLREIYVSNLEITSLGPIHKIADLKVLMCVDSKVEKGEIQRFKKNHPDCQITYY